MTVATFSCKSSLIITRLVRFVGVILAKVLLLLDIEAAAAVTAGQMVMRRALIEIPRSMIQ